MKYEIGEKIQKYRKERKLSQKELARLINVSNGRLSNWEKGINRPDVDFLTDICIALDVSPSELLEIKLPSENLNDKERNVIKAYRSKPEFQKAVDLLLGIDDD